MAVFRPQKTNVCELNFDDTFTFTLPLHEETIRDIAKIAGEQVKKLKSLTAEDDTAFDEAYNSSLDAIDDILGEGAADKIMSLFEKPGILEAASVITYISEEYSEQYGKNLKGYKAEGKVPPATARRGRK